MNLKKLVGSAVVVVAGLVATASADMVINLNDAFSPDVVGEFGNVVLKQNTNGTVNFEVTVNQGDLSKLLFNLSDATLINTLSWENLDWHGVTIPANKTPVFTQNLDACNAGADVLFDLEGSFTSGTPIVQHVSFDVKSSQRGLTITDFVNGASTYGTKNNGESVGDYTMAVHLQSVSLIGSDKSSVWVGGNPTTPTNNVPEPSLISLLGLSLLGVGFIRRKMK